MEKDGLMEKRRIQLIAGSTYSISLPKNWVTTNNLHEKQDVIIYQKNDKTLVISAKPIDGVDLKEIKLNIDEYSQDIHQIIYAVYYLGIETISLNSDKDLTKDVKTRIRKTLAHMAGTEISYEDKRTIIIKVLLDRSKVEVNQILYRISLLLEFSIENILGDANLGENEFTENEIDRLYHLLTKITSLSLINSSILQSSGIKNITLVHSYFRIAKKLEKMGDHIYRLCIKSRPFRDEIREQRELLEFIREKLTTGINYLLKKQDEKFERTPEGTLHEIYAKVSLLSNTEYGLQLDEIVHYIEDLEEEILNISFYKRLIEERKL